MVNDRRETTGGVIAGRVAVRDGSSFAAETEGPLFVFGHQADRRHAHHAAAALAVIQRPLHRAHLLAAQRRQTGIARRGGCASLSLRSTSRPSCPARKATGSARFACATSGYKRDGSQTLVGKCLYDASSRWRAKALPR